MSSEDMSGLEPVGFFTKGARVISPDVKAKIVQISDRSTKFAVYYPFSALNKIKVRPKLDPPLLSRNLNSLFPI